MLRALYSFRWQLSVSIAIFLVNFVYSERPAKFSKEITEIDYSKSPFCFSLFQDRDGSQTDPDSIPSRFFAMQNNRRDRAKKACEATLKWREENDIDTILARPHPKFDICKRIFPFYFCGRDDSGHHILLQRPGFIDLELVDKNKISADELLNRKNFPSRINLVCNSNEACTFLLGQIMSTLWSISGN